MNHGNHAHHAHSPSSVWILWSLLALLAVSALALHVASGLLMPFETLALPLAGVALYISTCLILGRWLLGRLVPHPNTSETFLAGVLLISSWSLLLGAFSLLYPVPLLAPLFLAPPAAAVLRLHRGAQPGAAPRTGLDSLSSAVAGFVLVGASCWGLLETLMPPIGMDALTYHLSLPTQYLLRHSILPADITPYYLYWQGYQMAILPLVALDSLGIAANVMGVFFLLALVGVVRRLAATLADSRAGLVAAAAVATSPIVLIVLAHTKDDLLAAAFTLAGLSAAIRSAALSNATARRNALFWAGLALGAGLGIKPTCAFLAAPFLAVTLWRGPDRRSGLALLAGLVLPVLYWAGRNLLLAGTVLAPNIEASVAATSASGWVLLPERLYHWLTAFFVFYPTDIEGPVGPALLLLILAAPFLLRDDRRRRDLALSGLGALILWLVAGRNQARFLLPAVIAVAAVGAGAVSRFPRAFRATLALALVVSLASAVGLINSVLFVLNFQTRLQTPEEHIRLAINSYPQQQRANRVLEDTACILTVGEARLFYLHRPAAFDGYFANSRALDWAHECGHDTAALARAIRAHGFTHVLSNLEALAYNRAAGYTPPPLCPRDEITLGELLQSCPRLSGDTGLGLYALPLHAP